MPLRICVLLAVFAVAACTSGTNLAPIPPPGYVGDVPSRVAAVDWTQEMPVTVRLVEFSFRPDQLSFDRGRPYRLALQNDGVGPHTFTSEGFFRAIAVRRVTTPQSVVDTPALVNLEIPPGETYVVEFVPVETGQFDVICQKPLHSSFGMHGTIIVR
ncbi:cupredoxin domain-containing protein [Azospirillum sp. sgz302134]